jgi:hypothetical protein
MVTGDNMHRHISKQLTALILGAAMMVPGIVKSANEVVLVDPGSAGSASPGFLMVIDEPGNYRLKGNVTIPDADTTAIEINSDNVTIDLNGFSIQGPTQCSPPPVSCAPTGSGNGVHAVNRENIVVSNGRIQGMGRLGIYLETRTARIEKVRLVSNGAGGAVFFGGLINESTVESNGGDGIFGLDIDVRGSVIRGNKSFGLEAYGKSVYADNQFCGNNQNATQVNNKPRQTGRNVSGEVSCP